MNIPTKIFGFSRRLSILLISLLFLLTPTPSNAEVVEQGLAVYTYFTISNPFDRHEIFNFEDVSASWIVIDSVTSDCGLDPGQSCTIRARLTSIGLQPGIYHGAIMPKFPEDGSWHSMPPIPVTMEVVENMIVEPMSLTGTVAQGLSTTVSFSVTNPGPGIAPGTLGYNYTENSDWMNLPSISSLLPIGSSHTVNVNLYSKTPQLQIGEYTSAVYVTSGTVSKPVTISLNVVNNTIVSQDSIYAATNEGCGWVNKPLTISNPGPGNGSVSYKLTSDQSWLYFSSTSCGLYAPPHNNSSCTRIVKFLPGGLATGVHTGNVTITAGTVITIIPVTLTVYEKPYISGGNGSTQNCSTYTVTYTVQPNSECTTNYEIKFGTNPDNLQTVMSGIISGPNPVNIEKVFENLSPTQTYYYKLIATNNSGTTESDLKTISGSSFPMSCNCSTSFFCIGDTDNKKCLGSSAGLGSGNYFHDQSLFMDDFSVYYNSMDTYAGPLGRGWTHDYNVNIIDFNDGSLALMREDGRRVYFWLNDVTYYPEARSDDYSTIVKNPDDTYTRTTKEGIVYQFNAIGKLASITDRNNNSTVLEYSGDNLVSITDFSGRVFRLTYDINNRIVEFKNPALHVTTLAYDENGLLSSVTDPLSNAWLYTYDAAGRMLTKTDPGGNVRNYTYDAQGKLISYVAGGKTTGLTYDPNINTAVVTDTNGAVWTYKYDQSLDVKTEVIDPLGNITKYEYDEDRNLTKIINPDATYSTYTYDSYGNLLAKTDELGHTTQFTYNPFGQVTSETDATGTINYNYDANGNLISYVNALGAITEFLYDSKGNIISITDPADNTFTLAYDSYNNLISVTDPANAVTTFTYALTGKRLTETDALGATTSYAYDVIGRLTTITRPGSAVTQLVYDPNGNVIALTDANGNTTEYVYNSDNLIATETNALGQVTTYTYGSPGCETCGGGVNKLTALTDARNNTTNFTYDQRGKVLTETDPLGKTYSYLYDSRGSLITRTDANGAVTDYTYDSLNRLTGVSYPGGASVSYGYNSKDRVTSAGNNNITYTITYDANGRMTSVLDSNGRTLEYTYDALGNRTSMTTPDGRVIQYAYDQRSRLTQITSSAGPVFTFTYDDMGRRMTLAYPNGITAAYAYDSRGGLTSLIYENSSSVSIESFSYTLDNVGNRLSKADLEYQYGYAYDSVYRLTQSQSVELIQNPVFQQPTEDFTYDPVGNRLTGPGQAESYEYNAGNQLTTDHKRQFGYDNNGNFISKTEQDGGATTVWTYEYDYENRLVSVTRELVGNPEIDAITFKYDPFGRRIEKNVSTYENGLPTTYNYVYVYDNEDIILEILERTHDGNIITTTTAYTHGPGIDEPLAMERDSQTYYFHADGLGSITSITDANEAVVNRYAYDSFGIRKASETVRNAYAFTGREYDSETELYYYRARYYDPVAGRFTGKDPIGFAGGDINLYGYVDSVGKPLTETNLYAYTGNSPVNYIDPLGLFPSPSQILSDTINYWGEFFGGTGDFINNYSDMRQANWIGADKYFHCKANCEAAQRGPGGSDAACTISNTREWWDQNIKRYPASDSAEDQAANRYGRNQGSSGASCSQICAPFRPAFLPPQY